MFEERAFEVFRQSIADRAARDFGDKSELVKYQCGCIRYDYELDKNGWTDFHISNPVQPYSIFDDPHYLANCLLVMITQVEAQLGATAVTTFTWLNSNPKWLAFFPKEWQNNMGTEDKDVQWHYAFWGQFITSKGTFNEQYGRLLREMGRFKYYPRQSHCGIPELREHLLGNAYFTRV